MGIEYFFFATTTLGIKGILFGNRARDEWLADDNEPPLNLAAFFFVAILTLAVIIHGATGKLLREGFCLGDGTLDTCTERDGGL